MSFYLGKASNKLKKTVSYLFGRWMYTLINISHIFLSFVNKAKSLAKRSRQHSMTNWSPQIWIQQV